MWPKHSLHPFLKASKILGWTGHTSLSYKVQLWIGQTWGQMKPSLWKTSTEQRGQLRETSSSTSPTTVCAEAPDRKLIYFQSGVFPVPIIRSAVMQRRAICTERLSLASLSKLFHQQEPKAMRDNVLKLRNQAEQNCETGWNDTASQQ